MSIGTGEKNTRITRDKGNRGRNRSWSSLEDGQEQGAGDRRTEDMRTFVLSSSGSLLQMESSPLPLL